MEATKTTSEKIQGLESAVMSANTYDIAGRQIVANSCKQLYNLIEENVHNAGAGWMLDGLYTDLCNGNFAEPFMCEQKKKTFLVCKKIYEDRILPRL